MDGYISKLNLSKNNLSEAKKNTVCEKATNNFYFLRIPYISYGQCCQKCFLAFVQKFTENIVMLNSLQTGSFSMFSSNSN